MTQDTLHYLWDYEIENVFDIDFEHEEEDDDDEEAEEEEAEVDDEEEESIETQDNHNAKNQSSSKYWFNLRMNRNNPSQRIHIPKNSADQTINNFFIQESLIGEQELSYIELKPDGFRAELVSMETNILELHQNMYTIVRDFCAFGEYRCPHCGRNWRSANSYVSDGMKCQRGCNVLVYAHKRTVKEGPSTGEIGGAPHREDLCGRCRRLGYSCR